MGTNMLDSR